MKQILHSQRRHILANLLRHGAASLGGEKMRIIFEKEFAPLLTPKERRTSLGMIRTKARLRDPRQGSDRLVELCSEISMTVLVLAGAAKILVPLL